MQISKLNCGEEIDLSTVRGIQLKMLDEIVKLCNKYNLTYFLSGGTLLGAIRHKGFIPWDDDIDINMPRPDIELIIKKTMGKVGNYIICGGSNEPFSPACQWFRLYNMDIIVENYYGGVSNEPFYHPIFIDIFPIDGFPEGNVKTLVYCKKLVFVRKLLGVSWHKNIVANTKLRYIEHILAWIPAKIIGYANLRYLFQKCAQKYPYNTSKYVGVTTTTQYLPREKMLKSDYIETTKVMFEGKEYNAPKNYDYYLSSLYSNYMQIPPKEKQKSNHMFKLYKYVKLEGKLC